MPFTPEELKAKRVARYRGKKYAPLAIAYMRGISLPDLAKEFGLTEGTIRVILSYRKTGRNSRGVGVNLPRMVHDELRNRALVREQSMETYVSHLLTVIHNDNMYNAILDDEDELKEGAD